MEKAGIKEKIKEEIVIIKENKSLIWDIAKKTLGVILMIIGLAGLFLPILPGFILIILGLALLGNQSIKNYLISLSRQTKKAKSESFLKSKNK